MAEKRSYILNLKIQNHTSLPIVKHYYTELIIEMSYSKKYAAAIFTGPSNFKRITRNLFKNSVQVYG